MNLVCRHVKPCGHAYSCLVHLLACDTGGLETIIRLNLGFTVVTIQSFHNLATGVGAAGVFEVCKVLQRGFAESGELVSDEVDIQVGHGFLDSGQRARDQLR